MRRDGCQEFGASRSTAEPGEPPEGPWGGKEAPSYEPLERNMPGTPRPDYVSTKRQRIAELARNCHAAWDFNQEVIDFAKSFILKQDVVLERDLSNLRDRDGTILTYAYRMSDRKMLNEALISSGFGIVRPEPKFSLLGQFPTAELGARTRLLGSWGWPGRIKAENEKRAHTWLKMGDNLKENNVKASRQYYADILATYPDTESAVIAREKLKSLPE